MVYTITLNPALDVTLNTDRLEPAKITRTDLRSISAGGKGFNASRALSCLGVDNIAISFYGGIFGRDMKNILEREGMKTVLIEAKGCTRVNIKVVEKENDRVIELNESGSTLKKPEIRSLQKILKEKIQKHQYVIIAGSLPGETDKSIYTDIILMLKEKQVNTLLDTSGEALYRGLLAYPDILKVNSEEFGQVSKDHFNMSTEHLALYLLQNGVKSIMITDGAGESLYYDCTGIYSLTPPKVEGLYKTGAGDAVNAGIAYGILKDYDIKEKTRFAIACGTANILNETPGTIDIKKVKDLIPDVGFKMKASF